MWISEETTFRLLAISTLASFTAWAMNGLFG